MFDRLSDPKCHPVLLIFALKGHWCGKYGDVPAVADDTAKELVAEIKKAAIRYKRDREQGADIPVDRGGVVSEVEEMLRRKRGPSA